jgi:hypothetical protein
VIAAALAGHAAAVRRKFAGRHRTIGASEIGQCMRRLFYLKTEDDPARGAQRNPDHVEGWGNPTRGTVFEQHFWEPALRAAYGHRLRFAGKAQRTFTRGFLSATPDGLLTKLADDALAPLGVTSIGGDHSLVVECKSVHPFTRLTEPRSAHVFQVQVGLGLLRELTAHRPEYALITYTSAADWSETREYPIRRDPAIFEVAQHRALQIMTATAAAELPPEGLTSGGRECEWCPYSNACLGTEAENVRAMNDRRRAASSKKATSIQSVNAKTLGRGIV